MNPAPLAVKAKKILSPRQGGFFLTKSRRTLFIKGEDKNGFSFPFSQKHRRLKTMTHHSSLPKTLLLATILSAGLGAPLMASAPELPEADTGAGVGGSVSALPPIIQAPPQEEMTDIPLTTPAAPAPAKKGWSLWPFSSSTPTEVVTPAPAAAPLQEALLEAIPTTDAAPSTVPAAQSTTEQTDTNKQAASDTSVPAVQSAPETTDADAQTTTPTPLATSPQGRSLLNRLTFGLFGDAGIAADVTTSAPSAAPQENADPSLADTAILATATPEAVAQDTTPEGALSVPSDAGVGATAQDIPQEAVLDAALSAPSSSGVGAEAEEEMIEDYVPAAESQSASSSNPFANVPDDLDVTSSVVFGAEIAARLAAQKYTDGHISFTHPWKRTQKLTDVDLTSFGKNFSVYDGGTYVLAYADQSMSLPGTLLANAVEQKKGLEGVWLKEVLSGEEKLASFEARSFDVFAPEEATAPGYVPANHLFFDKIARDAQLTSATQTPAACITVNGESFTISESDVVTFVKDKNKLRVRFSYVQRFLSENANTDLKVALINRRADSATIKMYEAAS
ncbi:MAG: hypothetical protein C0514_06545 [Candidatus Puniceispirillum sp.]|nr:hypothetical protein [Candidatus Puniceispirillum sp.]